MKIYLALFALFFIISLNGQSTNHILFTKGAELEYKTFTSRPKSYTKLELYEATRITLIVTEVKDSNGIVYSYVTKRGHGISKPEQDHYEKKYVLTMENNKIKMPKDLYSIDTIYLADRYPELKKAKGFHAVVIMNGGNVTFENDPNNTMFDYSSKSEEIKIITKEFIVDDGKYKMTAGDEIFMGGILKRSEYTMSAATTSFKNEGKASLKLDAGNFNCDKYVLTTQVKIKGAALLGGPRESTIIVYFHPEIGFLKTESVDAKTQTGYIELVRLKK